MNKKYNNWTIIKQLDKSKKYGYFYLCKCDCGTLKKVLGYTLIKGTSKSCGCLRKEVSHFLHLSHGKTNTRIYRVWQKMKARTMNKKDFDYPNYGGRGIKVCKRWLSFENFLEDVKDIPAGLSLDRIDNNGNYELSNIRLANQKEQCRNKRTNLRCTIKGKTKTAIEWCEILKISYATFQYRIYTRKMSVYDALTIPIRKC